MSSCFSTKTRTNYEDMSRECSELRCALYYGHGFFCQVADMRENCTPPSPWKWLEERSQKIFFVLA